MNGEQLAVALTPLPTAARVSKHRSTIRWRIISAVISLAILVAVLFFLDVELSRGWIITVVSLFVVSTVLWLVLSFVALHRAKKDLASITHGDGVLISRRGIEFLHPTPERAEWSQVESLRVAGSSLGAGPNLVMTTTDGRTAKVPMSFLDTIPSMIDSAVSAYSLGRVRLDTSDLDRML